MDREVAPGDASKSKSSDISAGLTLDELAASFWFFG